MKRWFSGCVIGEYVDLIVPTIRIRDRFVFWKDSRAQQQGCQDACCIEMGVYISISFNIPVLHNLVNLEFWLLWFSPLFIYVVFVFRRRKKDEDGCLRVIHNFHITLGQWVYMERSDNYVSLYSDRMKLRVVQWADTQGLQTIASVRITSVSHWVCQWLVSLYSP